MRQNCEQDGNMEGDIVHGIGWGRCMRKAATRRRFGRAWRRGWCVEKVGRVRVGVRGFATMRGVDVSRLVSLRYR